MDRFYIDHRHYGDYAYEDRDRYGYEARYRNDRDLNEHFERDYQSSRNYHRDSDNNPYSNYRSQDYDRGAYYAGNSLRPEEPFRRDNDNYSYKREQEQERHRKEDRRLDYNFPHSHRRIPDYGTQDFGVNPGTGSSFRGNDYSGSTGYQRGPRGGTFGSNAYGSYSGNYGGYGFLQGGRYSVRPGSYHENMQHSDRLRFNVGGFYF